VTGNTRTGAQVLVDCLLLHGAERAFCVPGESYLAALDALHDVPDRLELIVCRHESGAGNMAEAYGKLTGRPGICFVTRAPGASNASIAVHTAYQDSTPMILFVGQVPSGMMEREAFQEVDFRRMFGEFSKWTAQIDDAERIPEMISRAFHIATSGRPGPVVLALPEDMQTDRVEVEDGTPYRTATPWPDPGDLARFGELLSQAEAPLLVAGGTGWTEAARTQLHAFAETHSLPVAASFRRQDLFDHTHASYAGVLGLGVAPSLKALVDDADLVIALGGQIGDVVTQGYTLFPVPRPRQKIIHVSTGAEELGKIYQAELLINAGPVGFMEMVTELSPIGAPDRAAWRARAHQQYLDYAAPTGATGPVNLSEIVAHVSATLPDDAVIVSGAGNYTVWVHRFTCHRRLGTQLAPQSGSMGYAVPAGISAALHRPGHKVACFAGDGCFLMTGHELATAQRYGAGVVFIVVNNAMYGTIRMHQERHYPDRVSGTDLVNPDFVAYAKSFGLPAEVVERTEDFAPAFDRALAADGPALIEVRLDPANILPGRTIADIKGG
jgi:acetolactate synthase-1/2/3 large subunit